MVAVSEITRRPTRSGAAIALSAAGLATLALAFTTATAAVGGLVGTLVIAAGLTRGSRRTLDAAGGVFFLALLFAGLGGVGTEALLLAAVASILAWDVAENALSVGEHLGRETDTTRLEIVHAATTLVVLTVGAGVVYAIWAVASGGQPIAAVVLLLVGAIALVAAVRR
ncbi:MULTISPECIES: hypothetical protein [Haloferax]|uniref:Uncharacterized protein n=1 Tax=Haloferax marinum TaxID=2666143 RepID=A0A6A8G7S1_9EURY|nr:MULTISPECIES: hypothetical protein [Haloferax]KAB1197143.1 hypothetical protein Hfx1150_06265 [Haloferax sp. CBA1150]MRW96176.1 hypothetical protein [Haloferax marinum]